MKLTKEIKKKYEVYCLDSIDSEGYNVLLNTDKEKLQFLFDTFKSEYNHEIVKCGIYKAFTSWLQGLPSAVSIPFTNYDILNFYSDMNGLDYDNLSEKESFKILDNYFNFMMMQYFRLFKMYKVKGL